MFLCNVSFVICYLLFITANSDEEDSISEGRDGGFTNHEDSSVDVSTSRGGHAFSSP